MNDTRRSYLASLAAVVVLLSGMAADAAAKRQTAPRTLENRLLTDSLSGLPPGWTVVGRGVIRGGLLQTLPLMTGTTGSKPSVVATIAVALRKQSVLGSVNYLITASPKEAAGFVRSWHAESSVQRAKWIAVSRDALLGARGWLVETPTLEQAVATVGSVIVLAEPGYLGITSSSRPRADAAAEAFLRFGIRQARDAGAR